MLEVCAERTRDAVMSVAVREVGLRLPEILCQIPGFSYCAAAQAIRRVWERSKGDKNLTQISRKLEAKIVSEATQLPTVLS